MSLLSRLLATFALGLIATGLVVGFLPAGPGGCGPAFSGNKLLEDNDGVCDEDRAQRRALPVALIGLGLTAGVAAMVAQGEAVEARRSPARRSAPDVHESGQP
jgi:hypothetical protein